MLALTLCKELCAEKIPVQVGNKLGDGADGEVFDIKNEPNKVIKFSVLYEWKNENLSNTTTDNIKLVYQNISGVLDYLISLPAPAHARVYEHKFLLENSRSIVWGNTSKDQKFILYYYIMEKLYHLSEDEVKVFHSILSHEDRHAIKNYSPEIIKKMLCGMSRGLDFNMERVIFFYEKICETPLIHNDLHPRNIMKNSVGDYKLIDFDRCSLTVK